jgi:SNF2 family DNA or RNA helicase
VGGARQTLLNFQSKRRLLITGTPLQNDLMELWSLMHFLMPHVFSSHKEFKDWFCNPLTGMAEGTEGVDSGVVQRLHRCVSCSDVRVANRVGDELTTRGECRVSEEWAWFISTCTRQNHRVSLRKSRRLSSDRARHCGDSVLRPFLLRRLKRDVEKQLPQKHEHVIKCRLSRRQRRLYEEYMASTETSAVLGGSNLLGIINVLMQLRKCCNHPDLFAGRPIVSPFDQPEPFVMQVRTPHRLYDEL